MSKFIRSIAAAAILAAAVSGCSKASDSASSGASPAATMAYTGSTDTSTGGGAATPAAAEKVVAGDPAHGKQVFTQNCSSCHGATGVEGGVGPSLKGEKARKDLSATVAWIKNPQPPMPKLYPATLNEKDVVDVATYVQSL